jgi:hypothetical protein
MKTYGYYVNTNERGFFYADVRDIDGNSVYDVLGGAYIEDDESSIVDAGFMRNFADIKGLQEYLRCLGVIEKDAVILTASAFEEAFEEAEEEEEEEEDN